MSYYDTSQDIQVKQQSHEGTAKPSWPPTTIPYYVGPGHHPIVFVFAGDSTSPIPQEATDMPPTVDIPTVGKVASGIVFIVSVLSLFVGFLSGFNMIYAPMAILIAWFAACFYFMSIRIKNKWKK